MASIERTAYLRFKRHPTAHELAAIPSSKIKHFAAEAKALDAAALKAFTPPKRYVLILSLLLRARLWIRDDLADMFIKRMNRSHRPTLFRLLQALTLTSTGEDQSLMQAPAILRQYEHRTGAWIEEAVDWSFTNARRQRTVRAKTDDGERRHRRHFEVCVFSALAVDLKSGDIAITGSEAYADYGGYGGIAYHHVADRYVALFSHFIPCGVWEAIDILEGLLKNTSDIQPDTVHADTQGQSTPVFALAYLWGIKLMPRIRNRHDLAFFRPHKDTAWNCAIGSRRRPIRWGLTTGSPNGYSLVAKA